MYQQLCIYQRRADAPLSRLGPYTIIARIARPTDTRGTVSLRRVDIHSQGRSFHCAVKPPSTAMASPVTSEAASEQSHVTDSAISSGVPSLPMGWRAGIVAS